MRRMTLGLPILAILFLGACSSTPAPGSCATDSDCSGATPRCDTATSTCVTCLPEASSGCPLGPQGTAQTCCSLTCIETKVDPMNCGGCGTKCPVPPGGTAACSGGRCTVGTCNTGFLNCDGNAVDGCEVDGQTDANNCGACGNKCTAGTHQTATCVAGVCKPVCAAGYADCNASSADGCEVHTDIDLANCGGCALPCGPLTNAAAACKAGTCSVGSCKSPFLDCDGMASNGCEANGSADASNCGACSKVCGAVPNATPGCSGSQCGVGMCNVGFADCDGNGANGCETNLATDGANCGACGTVCKATAHTPSRPATSRPARWSAATSAAATATRWRPMAASR